MVPASSASSHRLSPRDYLALAVASLAGMALYLASSSAVYRLGFPLDDSWIHATYARNLAVNGDWAFQLGQRSAGSTAPFWTLLLVPGYSVGLAPLFWSYVLGLLTLIALGTIVEIALRRLTVTYRPKIPWFGLFLCLEWHMLWAAASGMETLTHATIATLIIATLISGSRRYALLGLLVGVSVWIRPDGLTLIGPVVAVLLLEPADRPRRVWNLIGFAIGFGALFVPYICFNLWLSGTPMPNTFYAKQAEYTAWQARAFIPRLGSGLLQLSTGPFVLLWPGLVYSALRVVRSRNVALGASILWCIGYVLIYAARLPAYQHGRYLMPAMPVLILFGFLGLLSISEQVRPANSRRILLSVWQASLAVVSVAFVVLGARAYAADVAWIESEMVDTARWSVSHLPTRAVLAAHDIGALGYFDSHKLVDLAGLVSPEVIPFIRDETRLAALLDDRKVGYLIAFPSLYPRLAADSRVVHTSGGRFSPPDLGSMTIYCWRCR